MKASEAAKITDTVQSKDESEPIFKMIKAAAEKGNRCIKINGGVTYGTLQKLEEEGYNVVTQRSFYWSNWNGQEDSKSKFVTTIAW